MVSKTLGAGWVSKIDPDRARRKQGEVGPLCYLSLYEWLPKRRLQFHWKTEYSLLDEKGRLFFKII